MTLRSMLAGLVLCLGCAWSATVLAQAHGSPAERLMRDRSGSPAIQAPLPLRVLPSSDRMPPTSADRWWARDKAQHVAASFLWTLSAQYVLVDKVGWSNRAALPIAAGSGAAVGLSKEWIDGRYRPGRRFSTRDLVADAVGILLAVGVVLL